MRRGRGAVSVLCGGRGRGNRTETRGEGGEFQSDVGGEVEAI